MSQVTVSITAPYRCCTECAHPGPPDELVAFSLYQNADGFEIIPHRAGCSWPAFPGGSFATVTAGVK